MNNIRRLYFSDKPKDTKVSALVCTMVKTTNAYELNIYTYWRVVLLLSSGERRRSGRNTRHVNENVKQVVKVKQTYMMAKSAYHPQQVRGILLRKGSEDPGHF